MANFMKIRPMGAGFFPRGRTDRQDDVNSRFSQICKTRLKINWTIFYLKFPNTKFHGKPFWRGNSCFNMRFARMWTNLNERLCASHVCPCTCDLVPAPQPLDTPSTALGISISSYTDPRQRSALHKTVNVQTDPMMFIKRHKRRCEFCVESSWNLMAHGDAREGKWRRNWRMKWVASTLHTTSEHGVSSITTADAHTSAASSRLNWRPPPI